MVSSPSTHVETVQMENPFQLVAASLLERPVAQKLRIWDGGTHFSALVAFVYSFSSCVSSFLDFGSHRSFYSIEGEMIKRSRCFIRSPGSMEGRALSLWKCSRL